MKEKIEKSNVQEIFELNMVQKGMLFHFLNEANKNLYNVQLSFRIEGILDVSLLKQAIKSIQTQHESLRSVFRWEKVSKPLQIVLKDCPIDFTYLDLSRENNNGLIKLVKQYSEKDQNQRFDLEKPPLRFSIFKISENSHIFNITHHHILYDGWSTGILLKGLFNCYKNLAKNDKPDLATKPTYKEIQQAIRKQKPLGEDTHWKGYLQDYELTSFFSTYKVNQQEKAQIRKIHRSVSNTDMDTFASTHKVTKAAIIYAAYGILLQKYNDTSDVVFGTTVSNRDAAIKGNDKVIGNFINTIPLRLQGTEGKTLLDVIAVVNSDLIGRSQYNYTSYFEIKQILELKPTDDLFDSVVIIENYPLENDRINSNTDFSLHLDSVYENTGIPLVVTAFFNDEVELEFAYQTDYLKDSFTESFAAQFVSLIREILSNANQKIDNISLLSENERKQLLYEFNNTALEYPKKKTLVNLFEEQVIRTPNHVALVFEEEELTYTELNEKANSLAFDIRNSGIKPNQVVALYTSRSLELYISILAVLKSGGCYLPLDPTFPKDRLEYMLSDTKASMLIRTPDLDGVFFNVGHELEVITLDHQELGSQSENPISVNTSEDLAYVIYTSGSTGRPKGVMLSHGAVHNYIVSILQDVPFSTDKSIVSVTTFSFDIFVTESLLPLTQGIKVVIANEAAQKDPRLLCKLIKLSGVKMIQTTPSRYKLLTGDLAVFKANMEHMECFLVGGEAFPEELLKTLKENSNARIINVYGPTETTVWSSLIDLTEEEKVTIGKPIGNTQLYVLNKYMQLQPKGVSGELYIGGDGLAHGYWNNPELTDKAFVINPFNPGKKLYKTGDLVRWQDNGTVEYLGRADFQVKIRGHRIEVGEIESQLTCYDGLKECVVLAKEIYGSKQLVAYYISHEDIDEDRLKGFLSERLPDYMVPSYFVAMENLPMTPNGKLDKKRLPEPELKVNKDHITASGEVEEKLFSIWAEVLGHNKVSVHQNFFDVGGDSLKLITVSTKIKVILNQDISVTELFNYTTIAALARFISVKKGVVDNIETGETEESSRRINSHNEADSFDIAIIGMAGRFPEADNVDEFWKNIQMGKESVTRKEKDIDDPLIYAKGFLREYECFDAGFFNYIPSEAARMDPQIRVFHECTWEALEDAGYNPGNYKGAIGLYGGASANPYYNINVGENGEDDWVEKWEAITYADKDFLCPRVSYKLNLKGPSVNIATACSTSLVAIDTACHEVLAGKCDMAIAGGISISLHDNEGYMYHKGMILSSDGSCRAFDAASTGTVSGNGIGMVVLKKLSDALRDGDLIHAVIKGSATNNDGHEKIGFTAPSIEGQSKAISTAIRNAGVEPESITYIEAHGTGTVLGDPIEIAGLTKAFGTDDKQFCAIGSVKTNIGHLDAAAGVAGLIKTVLSLKNKQLAPSLHFNIPNPNIDFRNTPFYVNVGLQEWKKGKYPRRAGISSFGIGGTNAHIILEEAPKPLESSPSRDYQLLVISAKTPGSLQNNIKRLANYIEINKETKLADVAYTLQTGREHFPFRKTVACSNHEEAVDLLNSQVIEEDISLLNPERIRPVVFMFSGQGSQYAGMCTDLYNKEAYFKETVDNCLNIVQQISGKDLKSVIFASNDSNKAREIDNTEFTQPALFIVEYALSQLLIKWGIKPDLMIGHSIGEYTAACISGVFSLEDTLKLVLKRGELMQKVPAGLMLSIAIKEEELLPLLRKHDHISLAAVNSSRLCVVSGTNEAINAFKETLNRTGYDCKVIRTSHAFHSFMMDDILEEFEEAFSGIDIQSQKMPFMSNLTGNRADDKEISTPQYWVNHLRKSVQFSKGIERILENEEAVLVEVGPGDVLATLVRTNLSRTQAHKVISLVRHPKQHSNDLKYLLQGVGNLWSSGVPINWSEFYASEQRRKVSLPTYAFEKVKFPVRINQPVRTSQVSEKRNDNVEEWFYAPTWKNTLAMPVKNLAEGYLIFIDNNGPGKLLVDKLSNEGLDFVEVHKGSQYEKVSASQYVLNPNVFENYISLFNDLLQQGIRQDHIIYNWTLSEDVSSGNLNYREGNNSNFYDLTHIVKAAHDVEYLHGSHITLVTRNLQNVLGDEKIDIEQSSLLGLIKVIAQEYQVTTSHIDISWLELDKKGVDSLLFNELMNRENGLSVALRNGRRWERSYERINNFNEGNGKLRKHGVYLITGGLGELGFTLAQYLLRNYEAKIVLLGRSELPPKAEWNKYGQADIGSKLNKLQLLAEGPGSVIYLKCNISDLSELQLAVETAEDHFGQIDGVIHAAGTLKGKSIGLIGQLTREHYEEQFETKLRGIYNLNEILGSKELDFCMTTSSISSLLGGLRFGAYSSANVAVDHFVNMLCENGKPANWVAVNFDGLAFNDSTGNGIRAEELHKVFEHLTALTYLPQIIVSVGDLDQRVEQWVKNNTEDKEASASSHGTLITSSVDAIEAEMIILWQEYFGIDDIKASDDFFELGGDSLKVLTIIGRIHKKFNVELSITDFFEHSTIKSLSKHFSVLGERRKVVAKRTEYTIIPQTVKKSHYPLSSVQRRLYFLYEFDNSSVAYNMPLTLKLEGKLDLSHLKGVFNTLIARHETLRTSFLIIDNQPCQQILEEVDFDVEYHQSRENVAEIIHNFISPFDLSRAPLFRAGVINISSEEHILMVDMPHIITDGVSKSILMKDFMALYNGQELDQLEIHYKDYSVWQQSEDSQKEILRQKDFWVKEFAEEIIPLDLPTDFVRPAIKTYEGGSIHFEINKDNTRKLRSIAEGEGTTLFSVLLAVYNILLSKLSGVEDVIIGTPISGRLHSDLEQMMGLFINTLPLRNQPKGERNFRNFLLEIKSKTLESFDNQGYPYELLIDELELERNTSRNPLFDAFFSYENFERSVLEIPGLIVKPYNDGHIASKFDLTLTAFEKGELIALNFEYSTKLFKPATIERFVAYFLKIVTTIVEGPNIKIKDIEIITEHEKAFILNSLNDTTIAFEHDKTIPQIFEERVLEQGETAALIFEGKAMSYQELNAKSNQFARKILEKGVVGDVIGIMLPRSLDMIVSIMGVLKAGCTYVPIDPEYPIDRIKYIAENSGLSLIIANQELRKSAVSYGVDIAFIDVVSDQLDSGKTDNLQLDFPSSQLAYIIYTSGSTGKPKGVMVEHRNVINFVQGITDRIDMNGTHTMLCLTTISFDIFVLETILPLLKGQKIILASASDQKDPNALSMLITQQNVDLVQITPSHLKLLLTGDNNKEALEHVKILMVGGEAFPIELLNEVRKYYKGKIYNMYGPTETTVWSVIQDLTSAETIDIGTPIANTTIRILNSHNNLQPIGIAGELCIGGQGVGRGYWKNEELTTERFINDPITGRGTVYRTGDLAKWLPNGSIEYLGRIDNQVKIRGFRIELGEIESQLKEIDQIKDAVVYTKGNDSDKLLVACYISKEAIEVGIIRSCLTKTLPDYMVPSYFIHLENLPLTPNGKIDRKSLPDPEISIGDEYIAPSTEVEEQIVAIWAEVLKISPEVISVNRSFFELGGNSLKAAIVVNRIFAELGVQVSLQEFFTFNVIQKISEYIENEMWVKENIEGEVPQGDEFIID